MPDTPTWSLPHARLAPGPNDSLVDVEGVSVGHATLAEGCAQTGVTAILAHGGNLFTGKCRAACHVINGFGKSTGLVQVAELGVIETPILLTNTLSVGTAYDTLVRSMLRGNPEIGRETGTVNPVIGECNDGYLNDIRGMHVTRETVETALSGAAEARGAPFIRGAVGAGRGMSCYELKGGIGTASRVLEIDRERYALGVLVMTNFGKLEDLTLGGHALGRDLARSILPSGPDRGSVIVILATDAPLSSRQLGRVARRAQSGLARTGAYVASGSGEVALAFSTRNQIPHASATMLLKAEFLHEDALDPFFLGATEAVESAVIDSLLSAETVTGRDGHVRLSLKDAAAAIGMEIPGQRSL